MARVSAVVPAYNAIRFVGDTLQSLTQQTHRNLEIILVDDGSVDGTAAFVRERFPQVVVIQQMNRGVAAARNAGIAAATGDYIAPVDADDKWMPHAAERLAQCLDHADPQVAVAYAWSAYVDAVGRRTGGLQVSTIEGAVWSTLFCHNFLGNASATMIRKSSLLQVGSYDPSFRDHEAEGCEDWDLYLRLAERHHFRVVPEVLVEYRKVIAAMSAAHPDAMARSHGLLIRRIKARGLRVTWLMESFSRGSFYQYLGVECRRHGAFSEGLHWFRLAAARGTLCTWFRPDFYVQVAATLLRRPVAQRRFVADPIALIHSRPRPFYVKAQQLLHWTISKSVGQSPERIPAASRS